MRSIVIAGLLACSLTSCVAEQPATGETLVKLGDTCKGYGFAPGTQNYAACLMQLDQNRIAENRSRRLRVASAMSNMGNQMQANARANQLSAAINRPVTCTSTPGYGGTYRTNCN